MLTPQSNNKSFAVENDSDLEKNLPSAVDDPELEREFQELAQWLLEVYLYRHRQQHNPDDGVIDN